MRELHDDQLDGISGLRAEIRALLQAGERPRVVMQAPTGFGKTVVAAQLVNNAMDKGKRVIFVVPAISLVDQTVQRFYEDGIRDVGVIQADHEMTDWAKPIQVASIQTLQRRPRLPESNLVVLDECFAGDTLISTPNGDIPISEIKPGDAVFNATGVGFVTAVVKQYKSTRRVKFSNGQSIRATVDHPFFTERGWNELEIQSRLFSREAVRKLWGIVSTDDPSEWDRDRGIDLEQAKILLDILREEAGESGISTGGEGCEFGGEKGGAAISSRRQRPSATTSARRSVEGVGRRLGGGIGDTDETKTRQRLSKLLQSGYRQSDFENWSRSGRPVTLRETQAPGSQEGYALGDVGVDDISGVEQTCLKPVYNLRVGGHPSYFAGRVLVHNCHKWFRFYEDWLTRPEWVNVPFVGLSATPWTKGLGKWFPGFVRATTTQELIDNGRLSPFTVFAPSHPDLTGVRTVAGDYAEKDLSEVMGGSRLVADVVETWLAKAQRRPTFVFAVNCDHAQLLKAQFEAAGVKVAYQDAKTSREEREAIRKGFHDGSIEVVCNVGTLTTGIDWDVRCISMARPTKSEMLFVQMVGRGLRTAQGKEDLLILDHSDNHLRLGFVTDIDASHNGLDGGKTKPKAEEGEVQIRPPKDCPQCGFMKRAGMAQCPNCGFIAERVSPLDGPMVNKDGELAELKQAKKEGRLYSMEEKNAFLAELKRYALDKGYKEGWAANQYRAKFGVWPASKDVAPADLVGAETASFIRSRQIAWANSKKNPRNRQMAAAA